MSYLSLRLCGLAVVATATAALSAPVPAGAVVDVDTVHCNLNGTASWGALVDTTVRTRAVSVPLNANCLGVGDDAGNWTINFIGTENGNCAGGAGGGSQITGTFEGGISSGSFTMSQSGLQLSFSGSFVAAGETHQVNATVDISPGNPCSYMTNVPAASAGNVSDS
jgi:hypothetical protein